MSEEKPGYNPEGLSKEEIQKIDKEVATKRTERMGELSNRSLKSKLKKKLVKGMKTHANVDFLGDKDEAEDKEMGNKGLNKEIKKLLEQFNFQGKFKLTASHETKGNYAFKLLAKPEESVRFEAVLEFEDKEERVVPRLLEYMENTYDKL